MDTPAPTLLSTTTLLSLFSTLLLLLTAYLASHHLLPRPTPRNLRVFYIWHLFSGLTHLTLEASFLYNCFFTYAPLLLPSSSSQHTITPLTGSHLSSAPLVGPFLARPDRAYGSAYGSNPTAKLWQEYARADRRWAGADLTLVSLELLTVGLAGPLALCVAEGLRRGAAARRGVGWEVWFWGTVLATGELYGGFMTFMPEWLSGSPNLDTSNFMFLWVYLFFFNTLWVWFPLYVLYEAYGHIAEAFARADRVEAREKMR